MFMEELELLSTNQWSLSPLLGTTHSFFTINADTVIQTWIILAALVGLCVTLRLVLHYSCGVGRYTVLRGVYFFVDLCKQSLDAFTFTHLTFITTLFVFIFACNTFAVVPWLEEPTRDLNTTLALGLISFLYIQYESIKKDVVWGYVKSYFKPFFLFFPLNVIGKLASVVSVSFRLFGNIFGGSLISQIYFGAISKWWWLEAICLIFGINLVITGFFTLFEGALQAFVFTMLTLTYLSLALQEDGH